MSNSCIVVVTGASIGLGLNNAIHADRHGATVYATMRYLKKREALYGKLLQDKVVNEMLGGMVWIMSDTNRSLTVVMMGATGAVGSEVVRALSGEPALEKLTLLGRRESAEFNGGNIEQHCIDVLKPESYQTLISGHQCAICTLGIGEPSKASKEDFLRIDKQAVLDFATACRQAGVEHFQLLSSVGADAKSRSFYLRSKGELNDALRALNFERLSLFQPSMIITPHNRYGFSQAVTLAVWPTLSRIMFGSMSKLRGIDVSDLGTAMANNSLLKGAGVEALHWKEITNLTSQKP